MIDLTGRRALVTGSGLGIGAGIALALARAGADVAVHYRGSAAAPEDTVASIHPLGRRSVALQGDLTDSADADRVVAEAVAFLGGLDIVVNNAGHLVGRSPVATMTDEHWRAVLDVNVTSAFAVTRAASAHLASSSAGRVVMMSSLADENGGGVGAVAYATAKSATVGFTRALAKELAPSGVTVNAVAPGFIEGTPFHDTFTPDAARAGIVAGIPLGRAGTVDDVAGAVAFLASDLASFITGQVLDINGGANFR
jgi:3-oxoacyl-[acyl-carrier protein] reductase